MEVTEAIKQRHSIRAFKPDPVPRDILEKIMEQALRAPSWANTQPWEFAVATGQSLEEIEEGFVARGMGDWANEVHRPYEFPEPYMARIRALAPPGMSHEQMSEADMKARTEDNFRHYGAPACIYLLVDRSIIYQKEGVNVWSMYDSGSAVQNIMLLATDCGLGTIAQAQAAVYPDIVRKVLQIPENKLIALGIAIGYPDEANPANARRTTREPLDKVVSWYGFD